MRVEQVTWTDVESAEWLKPFVHKSVADNPQALNIMWGLFKDYIVTTSFELLDYEVTSMEEFLSNSIKYADEKDMRDVLTEILTFDTTYGQVLSDMRKLYTGQYWMIDDETVLFKKGWV